MSNFNANLKLFRQMSEPLPPDKCNENLTAFSREVAELRVKYHLQNLICLATVAIDYGENGEGCAMVSCGMFGDAESWERMLAFQLGIEQAEHRQRINTAIMGKKAMQDKP